MDGTRCVAAVDAALAAHHFADGSLQLPLQSQDIQLQSTGIAHRAMCGTRLQLSRCVCEPAVASAQECLHGMQQA